MARYREELNGLPLRMQIPTAGCAPAWHLCVVAAESAKTRDELMAHLKGRGVQTLIHYPNPTHAQAALNDGRAPSLPVTENLARTIVSLPMNAVLREDEQAKVIREVRAFFGA